MDRKMYFQGALLLAGMAASVLTPLAARSAPPEPSAVMSRLTTSTFNFDSIGALITVRTTASSIFP